MGLFTKEKKAKPIPPPPVTQTARGQIEKFIKKQPFGTAPKIPTRQISDLTPLEQELQRLTGITISPEDFQTAQDVFRTAATAETDPTTGKEFEGIRQLTEQLRTEQQTGIRQRGELAGQLTSTPTAALEAENRRQFDTFLLQEFARLKKEGEERKLGAAAGLQRLGTERLGQISAVGDIASAERSIQQARNDAVYNQAMQTILFPYQQQLALFNSLIELKDDFAITGGGPTDLGIAVEIGGKIAAAYAGAG